MRPMDALQSAQQFQSPVGLYFSPNSVSNAPFAPLLQDDALYRKALLQMALWSFGNSWRAPKAAHRALAVPDIKFLALEERNISHRAHGW